MLVCLKNVTIGPNMREIKGYDRHRSVDFHRADY